MIRFILPGIIALLSICSVLNAQSGCSNIMACNYDPSVLVDDGSCILPGCTDSSACNYEPEAICDSGLCFYFFDCGGVCGGTSIENECGICYDPMAQIDLHFEFIGAEQAWIVPNGVTEIEVHLFGAQGSNGTGSNPGIGGFGAEVSGTLSVLPGETLYIYVGGQNGYNGGGASGNGNTGNGGGATDIRIGGNTVAHRVVIAGGGGGGGANGCATSAHKGGDGGGGGGLPGQDGANWTTGIGGGFGGQLGIGGLQGLGCSYSMGSPGLDSGTGGNGTTIGCLSIPGGGGGGGGHTTGGGGGGGSSRTTQVNCTGTDKGGGGGGAGGSNFLAHLNELFVEESTGIGHGGVTIKWFTPASCNFSCTDPLANNYEPEADFDDGSCIYLGCIDEGACNFDPGADFDDGSCFVADCTGNCGGIFLTDDCGNCFDPTFEAETVVFSYTGSLQFYTVPISNGPIFVGVYGASGGSWNGQPGGLGAKVSGVIDLSPGQQLKLLVGGAGEHGDGEFRSAGGGGGSFVTTINNEPLLIAGGGGGASGDPMNANRHASITEAGNNGYSHFNQAFFGIGGSNGNGAINSPSGGSCGGNGGGFWTNGEESFCSGAYPVSGLAFINGGAGGQADCGNNPAGGYGGGGGGGCPGAGGGGGYSGGGGSSGMSGSAGGGGSFNIIQNGINVAQANTGDGYIVISFVSDPPCAFGCTNINATNYDQNATIDDGTCLYSGCTYQLALNYDPDANLDDGSCEFGDLVFGCTSPGASNYNSEANVDDGSCNFPGVVLGCTDVGADNYNPDANTDNGSCLYPGCLYSFAANYNPNANIEDGSCILAEIVQGCTNAAAINYNEAAQFDDGSCEFTQLIFGCTYIDSPNYNPMANADDGSCSLECEIQIAYGCTDSEAINYMPSALEEDGSCMYNNQTYGCIYNTATNYAPNATADDGSCTFTNNTNTCPVDFNSDGVINALDLSIFLIAFNTFCDW